MKTSKLSLLSLTLTACGAPSDLDQRVAGLEKRIERLEAAPAAAPTRPRAPDPNARVSIPVSPERDAIRGGAHAKVTIVEAYEYACPYCATVEPLMSEVLSHYPKDAVRVVSKQFVVHPDRATNAALAVCAAQKAGRFAEFNAELWRRSWPSTDGRPRMVAAELEPAALVATAKAVGIDPVAFERELGGDDCRRRLAEDQAALARAGVRGTPSIFVNGKSYGGPRTLDGLRKLIDEEIALADRALASGVRLDGYYAHVLASTRP